MVSLAYANEMVSWFSSERRSGPQPEWRCKVLRVLVARIAVVAPLLSSAGNLETEAQVTGTAGLSGNAVTKAFLDVRAHAAGAGARYNIIFSYKSFSSFADHPRRVVCFGGYCSDAAGRYQFLSTTWDATRKTLKSPDLAPTRQDNAAILPIENYHGARVYREVLNRGQFERLDYKLNREWASFPGSPYGQPTGSLNEMWSVYHKSLATKGKEGS